MWIIIYHQNAHPLQIQSGPYITFLSCFIYFEHDLKDKGTAFAKLTLNPDLTAHQLDQLLGY